MSVESFKRTSRRDKFTGRTVDYLVSSGNLSTQASVVSLDHTFEVFGTIQDIFLYRETMFVVIKKIRCSLSIIFGLRKLSNHCEDVLAILPLETISRPLALARSNTDIWILNACL